MKISPLITNRTDILTDGLPITAEELGQWLNLSSSAITMQKTALERIIKSTTEVFEGYLWFNINRYRYEAYYELSSCEISQLLNGALRLSLERAPIILMSDIEKIEYLEDDNWVEFDRGAATIDGLYDNTTEKSEQREWASILFDNPPSDIQDRKNAYKVRVTFTSGLDDDESGYRYKVPEQLKQALLIGSASVYTDRGDCGGGCSMNGYPMPCNAVAMADAYNVGKTVIGGEYRPSTSSWWC